MEGIQRLALSLCVTALLTALFAMLTPKGRLERVMRFSVSLFFLAALCAPFLEGGSFFSFPENGTAYPPSAPETERLAGLEARFSKLAADRLCAMGEELLRERGFFDPAVSLTVHIDEADRISITVFRVTLQPCDGVRADEAAELLRQKWGLTPTVSVV